MACHKAYGRRIALDLRINKKRVLRVMKLFGLKPQRRRKKPEKPKDIGQGPIAIPNLIQGMRLTLQTKFGLTLPICQPGKICLSGYLRRCLDQASLWLGGFKQDIMLNLVAQALLNAFRALSSSSDRAFSRVRNTVARQLNLLKSFNVHPSMSEKASPWQNGYQESSYSGFKLELGHPEC